MKRIYVYHNRVPKSLHVKQEVMNLLKQHGFVLSKKDPDVILVIGGDGTMLSAIRSLDHLNVPFLGVNTGSLGFLPGVLPYEVQQLPALLKEEKYVTEQYPLLKVESKTIDGETVNNYAFNEVVIRHYHPRLMEALVYIDDRPFNYFTGDGFIVSTPIGTTGYAIWAGGAAIHSDLKLYQITPLHPNDNRINRPLKTSLVVPESTRTKIKIVKAERRSVMVSVDGLMVSDRFISEIDIRISKKYVEILRAKDMSYFDLFRNKIIDKNIFRYLEEEDDNETR